MSAGTAGLLLSLVIADPRVPDLRYDLELVAAEPALVTPVGLAFDDRGRLLVIESHTHFRPEDYAGPPADRIRLLDSPDGEITADSFRTFHEGTKYTMGLRSGPDGWVYVATRTEVFRLKDADGDGTAESREDIAHLETKGDYPHNGLSGLAVGPDGKLYFGMGENLGEPYALVGGDGKRLSGGGEGGNVFRCGLDGTKLERIATGFWNPFGLCFDPVGRLFAVDNDPDASPPCRLLHVVPGGDYGFQFRYGRAGKHPLQAWDGELPGTLPMAAGTGEAPCAVVPREGTLWVTSWGHHRIERFTMRPKGATVVGTAEIVVQGDENFRPVDLAAAPNGDVYFTDWVDKSYPLHGKGRLWRLRKKADATAVETAFPPLSEDEQRAAEARTRMDLTALASADPFLHTAAVWGIATATGSSNVSWESLLDARQRLGFLEALRWRGEAAEDARNGLLTKASADSDPEVRLYALRWIADERIESLRTAVTALLDQPNLSPRLFRAVIATTARLENEGRMDDPFEGFAKALADEHRPPALRAAALKSLPSGHAALTVERLTSLARSEDLSLRREAVRTIVGGAKGDFADLLKSLAKDDHVPAELRADALVGLGIDVERHRDVLAALAASDSSVVASESQRAIASAHVVNTRVSPNDPASWEEVLHGEGSADAGWRAFFRTNGAACSRCHTFDGRGTAVGPDLTGIGRRLDRRRLLESILQPSVEIAPQYVPWTLVTTDGRVLVGLPTEVRDTPDGIEHFVGTDGKQFTLPSAEIEARRAAEVSLMPDGLEKLMTAEEIRGLLALLAE